MAEIRNVTTFEYHDAPEPPTRWQRWVGLLRSWLVPIPRIRTSKEAQRIADACIADLAARTPEQEP
jgi:hypothetical protein